MIDQASGYINQNWISGLITLHAPKITFPDNRQSRRSTVDVHWEMLKS
jgi:hypothetical protein